MAAGSPSFPAASAPRSPGPGVPLVAGAWLPLAFIAFGLLALAWAAATLITSPQLMQLPHSHPGVVSLAHLWLPGFLLSASVGAIYQLMPVVLGTPLRLAQTVGWCHLALHVAGVPLLVGGFSAGRFGVVASGGALVTLGIGVLAVATWRTFLTSRRRDAIAWSFPLSVTWLAGTVSFGLVLALNRRLPFLPLSWLDLLRSHAHVGLGGYFLTLLQGATFQLVPMFTLADLRGERWVRAGLVLGQVGLLVLAPGLAGGLRGAMQAGALLVVAGIGCSGGALVATLRSRRRQVLEPGMKGFGLGAVVLGLAALCGLLLAFLPAGRGLPLGVAMTYGTSVVAGAISLMVMGMLCKIVPFLVWMKTYGPRAGRQPVPQAGTLGSRPFESAWLWLHGLALGLLVAGGLMTEPALTGCGAALLAAAVAAFLIHMLRVLRHLVSPRSGVSAPLRSSVSSS